MIPMHEADLQTRWESLLRDLFNEALHNLAVEWPDTQSVEVSYRDLEEIMAERGVRVDHATLNRWVTKYSPLVAEQARRRKRPSDRSWRMDETYIRVKGEWVYLYRAVDKFGKTLDFMLSKRRNKTAATKFFARALEVNGLPRKIVIDKSGANTAGINAINRMLRRFG